MNESCYLCIDLKSFYASVECVERGLDPLKAKLVVADPERGDNTICLAVTPTLKKMGVKNRCRIFQIPPTIEYIKAVPRMKLYIKYSARIYKIYLKYFSKDDIHVYSIDEVFIDASRYLGMYGRDAEAMVKAILKDIFESTGITAACGIGTNLYLAKIALDIEAKKSKDGIAVLNEKTYREILWAHKPITDFWRIGRGTAERLAKYGISTMGQLAQADEKLIYRNFGIDAELLIDHAWGRETVTMEDIKTYVPKVRSITSGQVLSKPYDCCKARLILKEMVESLCAELSEKEVLTDSISIWIGYSKKDELSGMVAERQNFRTSSSSANGSISLPFHTGSYSVIIKSAVELYEKIIDDTCFVKRINISFNGLICDSSVQLNFLHDAAELEKDKELSKSISNIKHKFGKNALFRAMSLEEGATAIQRNQQIGGHKA